MTPQAHPMRGVTKEQVQMQLDSFKRQMQVKDRLLEFQQRRIAICERAVLEFGLQFGDEPKLTLAWWDAVQKRDLYQLDADQSQLLVDNLNAERAELQTAIGEMERIVKQMESGILLPSLQPKPGFDPTRKS